MKHSKHMPDKMIRIFFCLVCGALAAARESNQILHPAANRFGNHRANQQVQRPAAVQQKEPPFLEPLSWRFPAEPTKDEPRFPPNFELRTPMAPESIKVICGENSIRVEAKRDLLGSGVLVQTTDVTLGGCAATEEDPKAQILIFESELHGCGSQLLMSEESFIYVFTLLYTPSPLGGSPIVRTIDVSVSIECHYRRKNDVSSDVLKPNWAPFSETKASEESLYFSLRLMTDNWQFPRSSTQFFLGDMMKFEASVEQFHHIPLRVTVDSCVATVVPNVDTVPRYAFLGNNGCMFDSQLTGSSSHFLPQSHKDKLQFELEAFRFQHGNSGVIYITCSLRATEAAANVNATNKACSFSSGGRPVVSIMPAPAVTQTAGQAQRAA
ncbi:zona pellucida sperm-binding protein 3-like isoform X2 [Astatotilapia calliptera]|uniref:zona pellucida sperm-binding protein 3-like isoform X2 n=1 Tax=Astatotilapia calliptera TaxID=8154 RepID=UPI000E4109BC|nr:zona pellucida sperm-binding protein 3-like isoform X2 [Astatotilapia calliptera]